MEKSKYNSFNRYMDIPKEELFNFINPINMYLSINNCDLYSLVANSNELYDYINNFYNDIFSMVLSMTIDKRNSFIRRYCTICYTLHTKGYDFS